MGVALDYWSGAPPANKPRGVLKLRDKYLKFLLLAPALIILLGTSFYPVLNSFWISLHDWRLTQSLELGPFVGADNYLRALKDSEFWNSTMVTLTFAALTVVLSLTISMGIALLLSKDKKHLAIIRALIIIPFAMSPALIGFSWRFMLDSEYGLFNKIIGFLIPPLADVAWFGHPVYAMIALVTVELWIWVPFVTLTFVSGLMALPKEVYEAANVDGASSVYRFFHITLPLMKPIIYVAATLQTMFALKVFDPVVTMTQGGPGNSTNVLNHHVFQTAFRYFDMGYAAALAYLLAAIIILLSAFYMRQLVKGGDWN